MKRAWINVSVGLGCVGLLATLSLPAMMSSRETARRSQCKNNLKRWGIALWNYHDIHQCFPPYSGGPQSAQERLSGRVLLLPYLDANEVWHDIRTTDGFQKYSGDPMKLKLSNFVGQPTSVEIARMICPSESIPPQVDQQPHASYAFCAGDQIHFGIFDGGRVEDFPNREETRGAFGWRRCVRYQLIRDGMANTIAMAERSFGGDSNPLDVRGRVAAVPATSPADCIQWTTKGRYLSSVKLLPELMGERWASGHPFYSVFLTAVPPNGPSCAASAPPSGPSVGGWFTASSHHRGGCNVLLCDGAVRFVNNDINHETKGSEGLAATKPLNGIIHFGKDDGRGDHHDTRSAYGIWGELGTINDAVPWAY